MSKQLIKREKGFTIIEVMIVLAIAALILLAVFLAVPALQRNSRNTQRKNDVAGVLGAINEYTSNQNGALPTCVVSNGSNQVAVSGAAAGSSFATCNGGNGHITVNVSGIFTTASIAARPGAIPAATPTSLQVFTNASCSNNGVVAGVSGRSVAAWYMVEPATNQCTES